MFKKKTTAKVPEQILREAKMRCNMSIDEAKYIAEYLEKHPDKKCTRFLRWRWHLSTLIKKHE